MVRKMDSGKITAIKGCGERTVGEINSSGICEEKTKTASFRDGRRFRTEISTGKDSNGKSQTGQEESLHLKEIKFLQYIEQKQLQADFEKNSLELKIKEVRCI